MCDLTCPEIDQILLVQRTHLLYDGPQPALEGDEPLAGLARLVVEGGVADEGGHVDVPDTVQQQAEVLRGEAVQGPGRDNVKHSLLHLNQRNISGAGPLRWTVITFFKAFSCEVTIRYSAYFLTYW